MRSEKERHLPLNALDVLNLKTVKMSKKIRCQASAGAGTHTDGASPAANCCHQWVSGWSEATHDGPTRFCAHPMVQDAEKGAEHAASA